MLLAGCGRTVLGEPASGSQPLVPRVDVAAGTDWSTADVVPADTGLGDSQAFDGGSEDAAEVAEDLVQTPDLGGAADTPDTPDTGPPPWPCNKQWDCFKAPNAQFCDVLAGICVQCLIDMQCKGTKGKPYCIDRKCSALPKGMTSCKVGQKWCDPATGYLVVCVDPQKLEYKLCPDVAPFCDEGKCAKCPDKKLFCAKAAIAGGDSKAVMRCEAAGSKATLHEQCKGDSFCVKDKCVKCAPSHWFCDGHKAMRCAADGQSSKLHQDCAAVGTTCLAGVCVDPCSFGTGNPGCAFIGVDLENGPVGVPGQPTSVVAGDGPYSLFFSNYQAAPTKLTVTAATGSTHTATVPAKSGLAVQFPAPKWSSKPLSQAGSGLNLRSLMVKAAKPLVIHQLNLSAGKPLVSAGMALNLPGGLLGKEYWVMAADQPSPKQRSFMTIIASETGITQVAVLPSAPVAHGAAMGQVVPGGTWAGLKKYKLTKGQVLNITSNAVGADFTGSYIKANKRIAVFAGASATRAPKTNGCVKTAGAQTGVC